ncbi:MAG: nickel/cobalt efflux transporter RcnA [Alphaproteobacteria bacterium]|nr:nickel/cobalt efflux transporter RcnA [Alphaproteobacteria bacterium]
MVPFADLIQQGAAKAWLFVPSAILLGALHGLEPGHSKTMMAAFIVAIRGTVMQAVLLGIAATVSHTAVVWAIAIGGLYLSRELDAATSEPYFQLASAAIIIGIASWMIWRTWHDRRPAHHRHDHHHHHGHDHHHDHHDDRDHDHHHHRHHHDDEHEDAHQREHAEQIRRAFGDRGASTGQIVLFGLTGGLIPCPAAVTVLLLCLQLREIALGAALVLCFSIGLALTLVAVGVAASLGMKHAGERWSWFGTVARRAPYASSALVLAVGLYVGIQGWLHLA